jgi:hypothetical protein
VEVRIVTQVLPQVSKSGRGDWIRTSDPCAQGMLSVAFEVLFSEQFTASENCCGRFCGRPRCRLMFPATTARCGHIVVHL